MGDALTAERLAVDFAGERDRRLSAGRDPARRREARGRRSTPAAVGSQVYATLGDLCPRHLPNHPASKRFLARLVAVPSAAEPLPVADVKNRLSEVIERLESEHGRVEITNHGRPAAGVLSIEDLDGLEETLEVLSNKPLMRRLRKSQAEVEAGDATELSNDEALDLVRGRR